MQEPWGAPEHLPRELTERDYVPITLTRNGEQVALSHLDPDVAEAITPLFVFHPVDRDLDTKEPLKSVDAHVRQIFKKLLANWGTAPAFVDLRHLDTTEKMLDGMHATEWVVREAHNNGWPLAPTVWATQAPADKLAAINAAADVGTSLCFRLPPAEWVVLGSPEGDAQIKGLLEQSGLHAGQVHVVLDMTDNLGSEPTITAMALRGALTFMPHARDWRSVVVAGTGMPAGTADVGTNSAAEIPRGEWAVWRQLREAPGVRVPTFGDYIVQHPDPVSGYDPRYMDTSAQLRYTIATAWFVARGAGLKRNGRSQIHSLAEQVTSHKQFSGRGSSWGDNWLADCADRECDSGGQGLWRQVTTNHHLTYVVRQIATLVGS
jgi:hypothetical protein